MQRNDKRLPVSIITGFLGSGKTTLLNHILHHRSMANSLVIINEFGEIGIDHLLVSTPTENVLLLDNGCLCCVLRGDLAETFADLYAKRTRGELPAFDRVIVETTGLADPVPVLQTIVTDSAIADHFCLEAVVTLVDGVHGEAQLESSPESVKQIAVADALLISKTDLVPEAAIAVLRDKLGKVNPGAGIATVANGMVDPQALFDIGARDSAARTADVERWLALDAYRQLDAKITQTRRPGKRDLAVGRHHKGLHTFSLSYAKPVRWPALSLWLNMLAGFRGRDLLRVKGILNVEGEPVVIQMVQTILHDPVTLTQWPSEDRNSRIVFITRGISQDDISGTLEALSIGEPAVSRGKAIDPAAYADFVRIAKRFVP